MRFAATIGGARRTTAQLSPMCGRPRGCRHFVGCRRDAVQPHTRLGVVCGPRRPTHSAVITLTSRFQHVATCMLRHGGLYAQITKSQPNRTHANKPRNEHTEHTNADTMVHTKAHTKAHTKTHTHTHTSARPTNHGHSHATPTPPLMLITYTPLTAQVEAWTSV